MIPRQRFCTECGTPLTGNERFCGKCGTSIASVPPVPPPPPPQSTVFTGTPQQEQILTAITGLSKTSALGSTTYYAFLPTATRVIIAEITPSMLRQQYAVAAERAKSEGSGFFGQAFAKIGVAFDNQSALKSASEQMILSGPDAVLSQNPGNIAIPRQDISQVILERKDFTRTVKDANRKNTVQHFYHYHLVLHARTGTFEYDAPYDDTFDRHITDTFTNLVQHTG